ncbi:hypothetical protein J421_5540 (plasmid) [Gemmatirosa kalamazoonensis]|uniref:Uncharacterized protein n=1 Tax=Gemmatirosa kalamazoonensis TaxID=861299 RepID=W0RRW8_9BACT|nr:hypothetical protein [Gemmatirosa kalamazoonensis]AHG93075.1 hypothetical protein J421_5540 [Gemmatirosa kalamazoonensis]
MPRRIIVLVMLLALGLVGGSVYASARGRTRQPPPAKHNTPHDMPHAAAGGHASHEMHTAAFDWGAASDRDLDVAAIFLTARRAGVRPALDSLRTAAARDSNLALMGHVVAHALGRFAVARAHDDPKVFALCTPEFEAGCWHGVMEGYFTSPRAASDSAVARPALDALCPSIVAAGRARLPLLECAHGMGHGLTARARNDITRALAGCDALSAPDMRGECHDGVFMEIAVRATEPRAGTNDATFLRKADPRFPCDSVAAAYQPSCWEYQPIMVDELTHDVSRTAKFCAEAPEPSMAACHHGLGKQSTGWFGDEASVITVCRMGVARHLGACLAGAAESYIDETWTPGRALGLCRAAPADAKDACYAMVGARMALIHDAAATARDCAAAEPAYVDVCRRGPERR